MQRKKNNKGRKKYLVATAAGTLILASLILFSIQKNAPVPHANMVDIKISLHSLSPITQNAVVSKNEFKAITFDTKPDSSSSLFKNQLAAVLKTFKSLTESKQKTATETGTWLWTPTMQLSPEYNESILTGAAQNGIDTIYVSIDSYLDIFVMEKGKERERLKKEFGDKLESFIMTANKKGIVVDAEAGWQNWAEPDHTYKAFAIVNYVKNFNETRTYKFRGFQYDVEPYLLEEFKEDPVSVLQKFNELVDKTENFLEDSDLRFSVVIPDFYDEKDKMIPNFSYNNKKGSAFEHLLNILDRRENSSIIVMSYRTFADGYDGSIEISNNEMQTAAKGGYQTKVIIAQETGDVPPPYITFHRTSKEHLDKQVSRIKETFGTQSNFGGIAIHYINALLAMK